MKQSGRYAGLAASAATIAILTAVPAVAQERLFDIPAQNANTAIPEFARQAGLQIIAPGDRLRDKRTPALTGRMDVHEGLLLLLEGTGLEPRFNGNSVALVPFAQAEPEGGIAIPDIVVVGQRSQNVDIRRSREDAQPYVVFDAETIVSSQAKDLNDFFRTRLPMNAQQRALSNHDGSSSILAPLSASSQINLRGLGQDQTLILVDGRRAPRVLNKGQSFQQADINGIPLSAIERIEILPSTAGGIYGGGAVGGVVNIIRKRDYQGLDLSVGYDQPFKGSAGSTRIEGTGSKSIEDGRTEITISASYIDTQPLYYSDNDLMARGSAAYYATRHLNPGYFGVQHRNTSILSLGGPLTLKDGTPLNSIQTIVPSGYRGFASDGGAALVANASQLDPTQLPDGVLVTGSRSRSVNLNLRRSFTSNVDLFTDLSYSDTAASSPYPLELPTMLSAESAANPFSQPIYVSYRSDLLRPSESKSETLNGTAGLIAKLGRGWTATAEYNWGRSRTSSTATDAYTAFKPNLMEDFESGKLQILRDINEFPIDLSPYLLKTPTIFYGPYDTIQKIASVRVAGSPLNVPGGPLTMTMLLENRVETAKLSYETRLKSVYDDEGIFSGQRNEVTVNPERSQSVNTAYVEVRAPLISAKNALPLVRAFELTGSLRYDGYTTDTSNSYLSDEPPSPTRKSRFQAYSYTAAARWTPINDVVLRASYGTGFLPPSISQVTASNQFTYALGQAVYQGVDPLRGNQPLSATGPLIIKSGGNPSLEPEESEGMSFGIIFTPRILEGFRFSADYNKVNKTGALGYLGLPSLIANANQFPTRVVRDAPSPQDLEAGWLGPIIMLDNSLTNLASTSNETYDFQADYARDFANLGRLRIYATATLTTDYWTQQRDDLPRFDRADSYTGPLRWRGNTGIDWDIDQWSLSWNAQYYHSYSVLESDRLEETSYRIDIQGDDRIKAQIYNDISVRYTFARANTYLSDVKISAGIQNLFNSRPPVDVNSATYSPYGDPRLRRFTLRISKHF